MNANPYPQGRWTPIGGSALSTSTSEQPRLLTQAPVSLCLLNAPLRELFWALPDSNMLEEARQRVDDVVAAALAPKQNAALTVRHEFGWF
jgi:hypothetical protein